MLKWGVTAAYCFARLLNRSGFGFVTVFECFSFVCIVPFVPTVTKHIQIPLRYKFTVVKRIHSLHSVPPFQSFHTLEKVPSSKIKNSAKPLCFQQRSQVVQSLSISCFPPRSTRSRLAAFHSASLHCSPLGIHSTCFPHSKKPMKIFIIAKDFVDEVSFYLNNDDFKMASFRFSNA